MSVSFRVLFAAAAMTLASVAIAAPGAPAQAAKQPTMSATPMAPAAKKPATAQQQRMKDCNKDAKAKALKGADRKSFMSTCLKGGKAAPTAVK